MSKVSGCTMVEKPDRGDRDSSNKLVDSGSKQPSPPVPLAGTGATNTAPTQVQSPHRTGKVRPWEGDPITQSVQSPQHQALPWETASVPPSVVPYNPSGWTSEPNTPPSKRPSYLPAYNKRDSSSVFESESDSELSSMEGPSSYFSFGKNLQRSQSNISERSYSYIQDQAVSTPMSMYGSVEQLYSGGYPYSSLASPLCNSTSSIPASVASMDIYYPPYSISSGYPVSSAGYSPMCQNMYHPYWMCYSCRKPKIGSSTVAIDNKIEQAMDLVKSHLMYAVREEVEVLKEQIKELIEKNSQLEHENNILKAAASPETLTLLSQPRQPPPPSSSS